MWSHGKFFWNELRTRDAEASKKFFSDTLGWTFERMPTPEGGGTYWIATSGGEPVAGLFPIDGTAFASLPEAWIAFIAVDDVDARVKKATKAGAEILQQPFEVPNVGRVAILRDPRGTWIGWMTPAARAGDQATEPG
jgi:predicted enzyme related to lactoylglutathione lyase